MITGKDVLITGGAGFIGSHLVDALASDNHVTVLDDFSTGHRSHIESAPGADVVSGDVRNSSVVGDAMPNADVVVHMAAFMGVERTLESPLEVLQTNLDGTRTVLKWATDHGVDRFLFASTSEVYGDAPSPPYREDGPTAPKTNYAVAKLAAERFVRERAQHAGVEWTILRYFNVYGPRQDGSAKGYVVPIFVRRALQDRSVEIHGDGKQTRDFTYIDDAVSCTLASLTDNGANEVYNVGTGEETSIESLAETVNSIMSGGQVEYVDHPRPYEIERRCADINKATADLGYVPDHDLSDGIRQTAEYFRSILSA